MSFPACFLVVAVTVWWALELLVDFAASVDNSEEGSRKCEAPSGA